MLAVFMVTNDLDGVVAAPADLPGSFRQAIFDANAAAGADTINFNAELSGSTILLTAGAELAISDDVTINGLGASNLTVDAQGASRVMSIANNAVADISGLTISGGNSPNGGGVRNYSGSTTTLTAVVIRDNVSSGVSSGGGIWNDGTMTITRSKITGNMSTGDAGGGGIRNDGTLTITDSEITGNSATKSYSGGGIRNGGTLTITGSLIAGNTTVMHSSGGGIFNAVGLTITDTTISGNTGRAGGLWNNFGTTSIRYSTIAGNTSLFGVGGIYHNPAIGNVSLDHTIVANNTTSFGGNDIDGTVTANWSLIEDTADATIGGADNITGVDPMLGPLADNGGPTETHALLTGSPALDAGDPNAVAGVGNVPSFDQRTAPFPRVVGVIDIGAVEVLPDALVFIVDTNVDENNGDISPGDVSLREAIEIANLTTGADTIYFDVALSGNTISLTLGQLAVSGDVTLTGLGADLLTVDAQGASRVISVNNDATVDISGLTLTGGSADRGGGLRNYAGSTTSLTAVVIDGNTATTADLDAGGGIYNFGDLSITASTISGNTATVGGGAGILNVGELSVAESTVSGNTAASAGGGVLVGFGTATIRHSTIVANTGSTGGGVAQDFAGVITLDHTIVANNTATTSGPDIDGTVTANWSLIEDPTGATINGANNVTGMDPLLGPLQDNGGPTQTHALLPGSPAFDAGDPSFVAPPNFDQRGAAYERVHGAAVDIGAYELLLADGNLDGQVNGLDYLLWANNFGDNAADDPPGSPQNGDYNNDGVVSGLDYLLWAGQFGAGTAVVAATPASQMASAEELSAVDAAITDAVITDDYDTETNVVVEPAVRQWRLSRAFDYVLQKRDKKGK